MGCLVALSESSHVTLAVSDSSYHVYTCLIMTNALKGYMKLILSPFVRLSHYKDSGLPILVNEATTPSDSRAESLTYKQSQTNQSDYIKLLFRESNHLNEKQLSANLLI